MSEAAVAPSSKLSRQEASRRGGQARMAKLRARLEAEGRSLGDYQREIRGHVSSAACRANGAKGAAATLERHGYEFLHRKVVEYRLAHPSQPEQQMMAVLDGLGYTYEREFHPFSEGPHQYATLDFFLQGFGRLGKGILVNGKVHDGSPLFNPDGQRPAREAERLAAIQDAGIPALVIDAADLADPERVAQQVRRFLTTPEYQSSTSVQRSPTMTTSDDAHATGAAQPQLRIWDEDVVLKSGTYAQGGTALFLETPEGEPFATISTWFPESRRLPTDVVYVKSWSENEPIVPLLAEAGLIGPAPEHAAVESGWVTSHAYRVPSLSAERSVQQAAQTEPREEPAAVGALGGEQDLAGAEWGDTAAPSAVHERDVADEYEAETAPPELDRVPARYFARARPRQAGMRESCKEARTPRGYVTRARARQLEMD